MNEHTLTSEKHWRSVFARIEELSLFHEISAADMALAIQALKMEPASPFQRRTVVRIFAAHVEGFVYMLKQVTLALAAVSKTPFTKDECATLTEPKYYVNEGGKNIKFQFLTFVENFKFAFKSYARVRGSSITLDCRDKRYSCFKTLVEVRNRLMHPKSIRGFDVSDEEITQIGKAWSWYQEQAGKLLSSPGLRSRLQTKFMPLEVISPPSYVKSIGWD